MDLYPGDTLNMKARSSTDVQTTTPRKVAHLHRDRGYRFQDRDPVLEEVTRLITDSGLSLYAISQHANISTSTLVKWCGGITKHPYNDRIDAVLTALGYRRIIQK